uniref:CCHC-type domain-containing protein n=1 Tax=Oryza punctata TaxID=4537 RepID=A0A0E0MIE1_ORYPU
MMRKTSREPTTCEKEHGERIPYIKVLFTLGQGFEHIQYHMTQYPTNGNYHLTPTGRKASVTCYRCGQKGHYALNCPKRKPGNGQVRNIPRHPKGNGRAGILPTPTPHPVYSKSSRQPFPRLRPTQPWGKRDRKRKTSSLITYAELDLTKMRIEMGDLPEEVEEIQLWPPRRNGCCFSCGKFGHYAIDCTQGTNEGQETPPSPISPEENKAQGPFKGFLKVKACSRCGEIGHYGSNCVSQCPYCDEDHPIGECPTTKITCFLCERADHVPQDCHLSPLLTKTAEVQRMSLRFAHQLMTSGNHEDLGFSTFD